MRLKAQNEQWKMKKERGIKEKNIIVRNYNYIINLGKVGEVMMMMKKEIREKEIKFQRGSGTTASMVHYQYRQARCAASSWRDLLDETNPWEATLWKETDANVEPMDENRVILIRE